MNWFKKLLGADEPKVEFSVTRTPTEKVNGMPVYEDGIKHEKLERREITVTQDGQKMNLPIDVILARFKSGSLKGDSPVLVTNNNGGEIYYCGEGTVQSLVGGWESAPLEYSDAQDITRMIEEFSLPERAIKTKADYSKLKRLYRRCDAYYRYIQIHDKQFKRITKIATKDLVLLLDQTKNGWDEADGEKRFAAEVQVHHPNLVRSEGEKKQKKAREQKQRLANAEKQTTTDTRNFLTRFPHKDLQIEIKDVGSFEIRSLKEKLRDGSVTPETHVRYRPNAEWCELYDFLDDWLRAKATINQIRYLKALQSRHKIKTEIPLDISKDEISPRISALAENNG